VTKQIVSTNSSRPVLAAEDDEGDAVLLRLAFKRAEIPQPLIVVHDGQETIDYLSGNPPYADRSVYPQPALLLLDLKMPRLNGFDVLAWWAARPEWRDLPVVVLSSSSHETDIDRASISSNRMAFPNSPNSCRNSADDGCRRCRLDLDPSSPVTHCGADTLFVTAHE
jgi:CheY-like chemotaxis protein